MIYTIPLKHIATDSPERKRLKKELAAEALNRLEDSARTQEEFEDVSKWWDRRDANRERRERYYEQLISNDMYDWDFEDWVAYNEDFLNIIFRCICQMHNLTCDPDVSMVVNKATDKQKAAFFPRYILRCTTETVAGCYSMTDRNVRKLTDKMIQKAQVGLYEALHKRNEAEEPLSLRQRLFLDAYASKNEKTKIVSIVSYVEKDESADLVVENESNADKQGKSAANSKAKTTAKNKSKDEKQDKKQDKSSNTRKVKYKPDSKSTIDKPNSK